MERYCPVIGIDLGTTNSVVSVWDGEQNVVIRSFQHGSHKLIPSFVAYEKGSGDRLVGWPAYAQWERNPVNTIFSAKRLIGRQFDDPTVEMTKQKLPFKVINHLDKPAFEVEGPNGKLIQTPEQIGAAILSELKGMASDTLRVEVTDAVITVPAYFNSIQREATRTAGRIAGLNVRSIINEPTAAALAYGLMSDQGKEKVICIFDLGGGTFDVTVMQVKSNGDFVVKATGGDSHLGGDDFDDRLMEHFLKEWGLGDISPYDMQRLRKACKETKENLSDNAEVRMELDGFADGNYEMRITRAKFEVLCKDLFKKALETLQQVLRESKVKPEEINDVVLVGGSCKMRKVQVMISDFFQKEPYKNINPDEVVAMGASSRAAHLYSQDEKAVDIWDEKGGKPNIGQVTDVIPLSLGVGLAGDALSIILPKNTPIPHDRPLTKSMNYRTITDNQELSRWKVYQGENERASMNFKLGQIAISNLPRKPKGEVCLFL
ncbi:Heat shock protein 70 2 [Diplonema papillatum]|nr:Heat shock protein 70 2 [Diplonema papillatum]